MRAVGARARRWNVVYQVDVNHSGACAGGNGQQRRPVLQRQARGSSCDARATVIKDTCSEAMQRTLGAREGQAQPLAQLLQRGHPIEGRHQLASRTHSLVRPWRGRLIAAASGRCRATSRGPRLERPRSEGCTSPRSAIK